ncbi:hypothetical protein C8R42DRAFT_646341 [Lentinula raphanica]|nr:hypothetical protein C8R42DRAFT_646341 [Lentinula raphanica]
MSTWISRNRWLKNGKRTTFELPSNDSKPSNLYEYRGRERKGILEERISRTREKYGRLTHFLEGMICSMSTGRVFTLLPRVDKLSHHHVHLEELVQNVPDSPSSLFLATRVLRSKSTGLYGNRQIRQTVIGVVPHQALSFATLGIMFAGFE